MKGYKQDELVLVGRTDTLVVSAFNNINPTEPSDKEVARKIVVFLEKNVCGNVLSEILKGFKAQ